MTDLTGIVGKEDFISSLTHEDKMLLTLRDEEYVGSWEIMINDLRDRLKVRPYIFKIVRTIYADLARIERLQSYELINKLNISDLLKPQEVTTA